MQGKVLKIFSELRGCQSAVIIFIMTIGFFLRVYHIGALGLIENEDYVVISANSILHNYIPLFPSGIVYPRAIPFSYIVTFFMQLFGFSEGVVRLPSAIFSTLSIGIVYLLGKRLVGLEAGIFGALLMSISDWEIMVGRTARMYSMFSFFFLLSVYLMYCVAVEKRKTLQLFSLLSSGITCFIHPLAGILVFIYSLFAFFLKNDKQNTKFIIISISLILFFSMVDNIFSKYEYGKFNILVDQSLKNNVKYHEENSNRKTALEIVKEKYLRIYLKLRNNYEQSYIVINIIFSLFFICSIYAFFRWRDKKMYVLFLFLILITLYFQQTMLSIYLFLAYLLLGSRYNPQNYWKRSWTLMLVIIVVTAGWVCFDLITSQNITNDTSVGKMVMLMMKSVKTILSYPPNFISFYFEKYPLMSIMSLLAGFIIFKKYVTDKGSVGEYYLFILFVVPILAIGFHPTSITRPYERYASFLNPYFILLFSYGMMSCASKVWIGLDKMSYGRAFRITIGLFLIVSILIGTDGFNIRKSFAIINMQYGFNKNIIDADARDFFYYPDHQGPSLFVKDNYKEGDIVIAMDVLAHFAYFPRVDYQLTLGYKGDAEGWLRGKSIRTSDQLRNILELHQDKLTWIILSGEKLNDSKRYSGMQEIIAALKFFDKNKVFNGRDGLSDVYLIERDERAGAIN